MSNCEMSRVILGAISLLLYDLGSGLPIHSCNPLPSNQWTDIPVILDADHKAGLLTTHDFPRRLPSNLPFRCRWILNNLAFSGTHVEGDLYKLYIYFTQLYLQASLITVKQCNHNFTVCDTFNREWNTADHAVITTSPYLLLELSVPTGKQKINFRVMEVSEQYGLNITYEVRKESERHPDRFFSCSLVECHFNGECIVNATPDGKEVENMSCRCNNPVDDSTSSRDPFYGKQCQYHNKHGHCTGKESGHRDANSRCNNQPCYYLTSRYVKCDCNKGWEGRGCERKVEEDEEIRGAQKCAQQKIFNISVEIVRTYSSEDLKRLQKEIRYFWNIACNCSLISLLQRSESKASTFFIVISGLDGDVRRTIDTINSTAKMTALLKISKISIISETQPCITKLEVNQSSPLYQEHEFSISCFAKGSGKLKFSWYKDDKLVNISVADRFMKEAVYHIESEKADRVGVLSVSAARKFDSGVFRCSIADQGVSVSKSLNYKLEVINMPEIDVHPKVVVLSTKNGKITNSGKKSSIFCFMAETSNLGNNYTFSWEKKALGSNSDSKPIDPEKSVETVEPLILPRGLLIRLDKIKESASYVCKVTNSNRVSRKEVKVYLLPKNQINKETCHPTEDHMVIWPRTHVNTRYSRHCFDGYQGMMHRYCHEAGDEGYWGEPDQSRCVRDNLLSVENMFEEIKSGYTRNVQMKKIEEQKIIVEIFGILSSETKKSRLPTAAEYQLILNLLEGAAKYLYNMDFRRNKDDVQNKDYWKKQILSVKEEFYTVIKYLTKYGKKKVNVQAVRILKLLQQNSLVMSRDLDVGETEFFDFCPTMIYTKRMNIVSPDENKSYKLVVKDEKELKLDDSCGLFDSFVKVWISAASNLYYAKSQNAIKLISVIFLDDLDDFMKIEDGGSLPSNSRENYIFEFISNLVTVVMESETLMENGEIDYQPIDSLSTEDLILTIEFALLNSSFNLTGDSLHCGQVPGPLNTDLPVTNTKFLYSSPNCFLKFSNLSKQPQCVCNTTGTFGLVLSRPDLSKDKKLLSGIPTMLLYGCMLGLMFSSLTLCLLIKAYILLEFKSIVLLKLTSSFTVSSFFFIIILSANKHLPDLKNYAVSLSLQSFLVTALSSQLGIVLNINCKIKHFARPIIIEHCIVLLSLGLPVMMLLAFSLLLDLKQLENDDGGQSHLYFQFIFYISLAILIFIVILSMSFNILRRLSECRLKESHDNLKLEGIIDKIETIKRAVLFAVLLVIVNICGILYVNYRLNPVHELLLSLSAACLGLSVFFCYIVKSEEPLHLLCGNQNSDASKDVGSSHHEMEFRPRTPRSSGSETVSVRSQLCKSFKNDEAVQKRTSFACSFHETFNTPAEEFEDGPANMQPAIESYNSSLKILERPRSLYTKDTQEKVRESSISRDMHSCKICRLKTSGLRHPLRSRCLIRDDSPKENLLSSIKGNPETLTEVIEKVKSPQCEDVFFRRVDMTNSFSSEYRSHSRRSTITSSLTLVTSSDNSDYVAQEFPNYSGIDYMESPHHSTKVQQDLNQRHQFPHFPSLSREHLGEASSPCRPLLSRLDNNELSLSPRFSKSIPMSTLLAGNIHPTPSLSKNYPCYSVKDITSSQTWAVTPLSKEIGSHSLPRRV